MSSYVGDQSMDMGHKSHPSVSYSLSITDLDYCLLEIHQNRINTSVLYAYTTSSSHFKAVFPAAAGVGQLCPKIFFSIFHDLLHHLFAAQQCTIANVLLHGTSPVYP